MIDINVILLDINSEMCRYWSHDFSNKKNVKVVNADLEEYFKAHYDEIDCVCSAANSYAILDGGWDLSLRNCFNEKLQFAIQDVLIRDFYGEQPVGSSIIVDVPDHPSKKVIHTPTMIVPSIILDDMVVYTATRSALCTALKNQVHTMIMPAYGACTGRVPKSIVGARMREAFDSIEKRINDSSYNTWQKVYGM